MKKITIGDFATTHKVEVSPSGCGRRKLAPCSSSIAPGPLTPYRAQVSLISPQLILPQFYEQLRDFFDLRKLTITLFLSILLIFTKANSYDYNLSICAIFQDEEPYLKEWIEFHRLLGVEHFWLYDNNSQDDYLSILNPYIKAGIIELIYWPSPPDKSWIPYQREAYDHCIRQSSKKTKWLAVIDIDEFIMPVRKKEDLLNTLKKLEKDKHIAALKLDWQTFGTSFLWEIDSDKTLLESLTFRAVEQDPCNLWVKSICRPDRVLKCGIHQPVQYKKNCYGVHANGAQDQPLQVDFLRINHYWTRTEKYFYDVKIPRRERFEGRIYTQEEIDALFQHLNVIEDLTAIKYASYLKKRLIPAKGNP